MLTTEHKKELIKKIKFIDDLNVVIQNYVERDLNYSYLVLYKDDDVREYLVAKNKHDIILDACPCHINSLKRNLIEFANRVMHREYDSNVDDIKQYQEEGYNILTTTEEIYYCPHCGSPNIFAIGDKDDLTKYICENCQQDFIIKDKQ